MRIQHLRSFLVFFFLFLSHNVFADIVYTYESDEQEDFYQEGFYPIEEEYTPPVKRKSHGNSYKSRLPHQLSGHGEKVILVDPRVHAWGAYNSRGKLLRAGLATAGSKWCADLKRPCKTKSGVFRIYSLGDSDCYSRKFPLGEGGAPMPYCMYFNGGQGLHGSYAVTEGNRSHGCVRVSVSDAEWIRYNFAGVGTKVIVRGY